MCTRGQLGFTIMYLLSTYCGPGPALRAGDRAGTWPLDLWKHQYQQGITSVMNVIMAPRSCNQTQGIARGSRGGFPEPQRMRGRWTGDPEGGCRPGVCWECG